MATDAKNGGASANGVAANGHHDATRDGPSKRSVLGLICIMSGSFLAAVMFLVVKLLANHASSFQLLFYRGLVQVVLSLLAVQRSSDCSDFGRGADGNPNSLWPSNTVGLWLIVRAALGSAAVCAWFWGCQVLPLPDAVTLQFTSPPFAAAFAVCLVGEPWLPLDIFGAVVCLTGVVFISHPTWLFGPSDENTAESDMLLQALGVVVTTIGAALAGLAYVCVRVIRNRASAVVMVFYYGLVSIPVAVLGAAFFEAKWNVFTIVSDTLLRDSALILLVGILGHTAQWLLNIGLQIETAATATLGTTTMIVWTYLFELAFLHEALNRWSLGGTGLILGYMLLVAVIKTRMSIPSKSDAQTQVADDEETVLSEKTPLISRDKIEVSPDSSLVDCRT